MVCNKYSGKNMRPHEFQNLWGTLRRTLLGKTQKETVLNFYNIMAITVLLYGSECWTLTKQQINKKTRNNKVAFLETGSKILPNWWKRNEDISKELDVADVITRIKNYQSKWWDYMEGMKDQRIPKILFKYSPADKRDPGRPRNGWKGNF